MKFLVLRDAVSGLEWPVVFPDYVPHVEIVNVSKLQRVDVVSAGQCFYNCRDGFCCHGSSTGLGVAARGTEDELLLDKMISFKS